MESIRMILCIMLIFKTWHRAQNAVTGRLLQSCIVTIDDVPHAQKPQTFANATMLLVVRNSWNLFS